MDAQLLADAGFIDYGDSQCCMRLGCKARPTMRASGCDCIALCQECLTIYQQALLRLPDVCPRCFFSPTTFTLTDPPPSNEVTREQMLAQVNIIEFVKTPPVRRGPSCKQCGAASIERISKSAKNPGRAYWACPQRCPNSWIGWVVV